MQEKTSAEAVRWNVKVSPDTDSTLRHFLGEQELRRGGRSRFIEEAVRARVFQLKVQDIQSRNAHMDPAELQALIDASVKEVRKSGRSRTRSQCE